METLNEKEAVEVVLKLAQQWGYGNMIAHLKRAWADDLARKYKISPEVALKATDVSAYSFTGKET